MQNFPVKYTDKYGEEKTAWVSRSMAVSGFIFNKHKGEWYVLASRRGLGAMDMPGYWNCTCGYLDWGETIHEAMSRELFEELGVLKNAPIKYTLLDINSDPSENRQNVTVRFLGITQEDLNYYPFTNIHSEENEVDEIKWIKVKDVKNYQWAFNHNNIIEEYYKKYVGISWFKRMLRKIGYILIK